MTKSEFLKALEERIGSLSLDDRNNILDFYEELIEDQIEDGGNEEEIISKMGSLDDIVRSLGITVNETTGKEEVKELPVAKTPRRAKKNVSKTKIIVLACTSIIWGPFAIAFIAIILALIVSFVALALGLSVMGLWGFVYMAASFYYMAKDFWPGLFQFGASLVMICLGTITVMAVIKLIKVFVRVLPRFIRWIGRTCKKIGGKLIYE